MSDKLLSINEIAKQLNIPETTCRRYADTFEDFLAPKIYGRVKKYLPETVEMMNVIYNLYQQGFGTVEIKERLAGEYSISAGVEEEHHNYPTTPLSAVVDLISAQNKIFQEISDALSQLADREEEIKTLRTELEEIKELLKQKEEAEIKSKEARSWWQKVFGK